MSDDTKKPPAESNPFMSNGERDWLTDHRHHVNDIGDAEEREDWRDRTRLRSLGIDPEMDQLQIYLELKRRIAAREPEAPEIYTDDEE